MMAPSNRNDKSRETFVSRFVHAISSPFHNFMDEAFSGQGSSSSSGPVALLTAPFRFLAGVAVFLVQAWTSSRSGLAFVVGLPALIAVTIFLGCVWFATFHQTRLYGSASFGFKESLERAVEPKERFSSLQDRVKFAKRMVRLRPESIQDKYELGAAKGSAGDIPAAVDIMKLLAPDDQPGLSDAHLWRAGFYQNETFYQASDEERDEIVLKQLDLAIRQQEGNKQAHKSMSIIHIRKAATFDTDSVEQKEHLKKALTHLDAMLDGGIQSVDHLLAAMQIVEIQKQVYGVKQARKSFDSMYANILEPASKRFPNIFQIWLVLVKCAVALEDFPLAKEFVRDGFVTSSSNDVRKQIADLSSLVLLQEADIADDMTDPDQYRKRLYALTRAINVNPKSDKIYKRLIKFIDSGAGEQFNMDLFQESKVAAPDPGVLSTMLGLRAVMDGNESVAKTHWRVSQQLYTLSELVLNHLIVVGAKSELSDFSDPIDLLTRSLESFPDNPVLLQSRGYFLIKEGEDGAAVADLEKALEKLPNLVEARQFLILLHKKMGDANQAAYHQQRQDDTLNTLPENQRVKLSERLEAVTL